MAKVAIITRTKDRPLFLKRAIESVSSQTMKDYEHVIVNDGGKKSEVDQIVKNIEPETKSKIVIFHREKPSGAPDTIFNESIDRVKSKYVAIHDDDDSWHPEFLERTTTALDNGSRGVVVRTNRIYEKLINDATKTVKTKPYMKDLKSITLERQCFENQLTPVAFVFERNTYEKIGKYDDSLPVAGDWEFGIRFLMNAKAEFLDPGFALAYYHRRINIEDHSYNTRSHKLIINEVAEKYLNSSDPKKQEVGRLIKKLQTEHDNKHKILRKLIPKRLLKYRRKFIN